MKWWPRISAPTLALVIYAFGRVFVAARTENAILSLCWSSIFGWLIANWALRDARLRGVRMWHDSDTFLYFLWPALVPIYLFKTRGLRGIIPILNFIGIWLAAILARMALR